MHPFPVENIDGAGERGGYRRDKDRVAPVFKLLDDECGDEGLFDLDQRRLPDVLTFFARYLLGQAPEERVARDLFEEASLDPRADRPSCSSADGNADQETDRKDEEKGQCLLGRKPVWEELGEWPHQSPDRFHSLKQYQDGKVNRDDNEQAAKKRFCEECEGLFIFTTLFCSGLAERTVTLGVPRSVGLASQSNALKTATRIALVQYRRSCPGSMRGLGSWAIQLLGDSSLRSKVHWT